LPRNICPAITSDNPETDPWNDAMMKKDIIDLFKVKPDTKIRLKDYHTGWQQTEEFKSAGKKFVKQRAGEVLQKSIEALSECQQLLYADDRYALLIVLQAMDGAGKDGTIRHVMSGVNP
jgi:polyphosphate kinase 2 (PPK2 family)